MNFIFKEAKKVVVTLLIINVIIIVVTALLKILDMSVIYGIIYGFVFSILNFILLGTIVERALSMTPRRAKRHMQINYAVRLMLMGVILAIPFALGNINGWCVCVALLAPRITYLFIGFYSLIPNRKEID